ncbi:tetratricopeptide repeat protein 5-like isoform X2 [Cimex lectularius]|nr:tetratricopeptide repeat protein 5-like isoform X2 [Cimex lectularius]
MKKSNINEGEYWIQIVRNYRLEMKDGEMQNNNEMKGTSDQSGSRKQSENKVRREFPEYDSIMLDWERSELGTITARKIEFKQEDKIRARETYKRLMVVLEDELFIPGPTMPNIAIPSAEMEKLDIEECTNAETSTAKPSKMTKTPKRHGVKTKKNTRNERGEHRCTSPVMPSVSPATGIARPSLGTDHPLSFPVIVSQERSASTSKGSHKHDSGHVARTFSFNESLVEVADAMAQLMENSNPVEAIYKLLMVQRDVIHQAHSSNDPEADQIKLTPEELINTLYRLVQDLDKFLGTIGNINNARQKVNYWILLGRIYMYMPNLHSKMIDGIERAAKLDPTRHEPWNMLGDFYYYKRNNLTMARSCFENGAAAFFNPVSLRMLALVELKCVESMAGLTPTDRRRALTRSIIYAQHAVLSKFDDGKSWMILGNTYLTSHFSGNPSPNYPKYALACYLRTERSLIPFVTPELYFNKYIALTYLEHFYDGICALNEAKQLNPGWMVPKLRRKHLKKYLQVLTDYSLYYGYLSTKKISQMKKVIRDKGLTLLSSFTGTPSTLEDLKSNDNPGRIIYGKVIWTLSSDYIFPYTFGMIDVKGTSFVVTVFYMQRKKKFVIGDNIGIKDPILTHYNFVFGQAHHEVKFSKIRVNCPTELILNGLPVPKAYVDPREL